VGIEEERGRLFFLFLFLFLIFPRGEEEED
jgi:hypothetical protein